MSRFRKSSSFCLICYKTIDISNITNKKLDNIEKFVRIVSQFAGTQQVYPLFDLVDVKKLLECCRECRTNIETFCKIYDQIKIEELNIAKIVDKLAEKINHSDKLPLRLTNVNKVLEQIFRNDQDKTIENQYRISRFRQSILEVGHYKKLRFQPAVIINHSENDNSTEELDIKDEIEEKYSPDAENDLENEDQSTEPIRKKSVSFTFPSCGTGNEDISRSEDYSRGVNGDSVEETLENNEYIDTSDMDTTESNGTIEDFPVEIKQEPEIFEEENCEKIGNTSQNLQMDLQSKNPKDWNRVSKNSPRKFGTIHGLIAHVRNKQKERMTSDSEYSEREQDTNSNHVSVLRKKRTRQKRFLNSNEIQKTKRNAKFHTNIANIAIPSCSKNLTIVSKPILFECEICTRKFKSSIRKNIHLKKMHDLSKFPNKEKSFNCGWRGCKAYFLTKFQLKQHLKFEHGGKNEEKGKFFDCDKCGKKFVTKFKMELHMKGHVDREKGKFKCETCGEEFNYENTLKIHLELHKKLSEWGFGCEICGRKFVTRGSLNYHVKLHENEDSHWECDICGVRFRDTKSLIGHLSDQHLK